MDAPRTAPKRRSWRNGLIAPKFQLKFVLWFSLHGIILGAFYNALVTYFVKRPFALLLDGAGFSAAQQAELLGNIDALVMKSLAATGVFVALCAVSGLIFSHRAVGPLFRLKETFARVKGGDLKARCTVRSYDEFQDLADSFNDMMGNVESKIEPKK